MNGTTSSAAVGAGAQVFELNHRTVPMWTAGSSLLIVAPIEEWQRAVRRARPGDAACYRELIDARDGEPTWEDAEWQ